MQIYCFPEYDSYEMGLPQFQVLYKMFAAPVLREVEVELGSGVRRVGMGGGGGGAGRNTQTLLPSQSQCLNHSKW